MRAYSLEHEYNAEEYRSIQTSRCITVDLILSALSLLIILLASVPLEIDGKLYGVLLGASGVLIMLFIAPEDKAMITVFNLLVSLLVFSIGLLLWLYPTMYTPQLVINLAIVSMVHGLCQILR